MGGFCNPRGFPAIAATAAVAALLLSGLAAPADTQPAPELTAAQKERLKERDRIGKQVEAMRAQKKLPEAIKAAEAKLAIEREVLGETGDAAIESLELLAQLHQDVEDWAAATRARTEVLALRTRTQSKDQRQSKEARWALERVETLAKLDRAGRSRLAEADRLDRQVYELFARGENRKAEGLARQAVQIRQELQGEHHPDYALSLSNLASQLMHMGQPAAARQLLERVAALTRETLGEDHDRYAYCLLNLAGCCLIQGDYVPARPMLEKALALIKQSHGERHPVFILCLNNLAGLFVLEGDYAAARPLLERVVSLSKEAAGDHHPDYARSLNNLAGVAQKLGDLNAARPLYEQCLALTKELLGPRCRQYASTLNNLAMVRQAQGQPDAARVLLEQSLALHKEIVGEWNAEYIDGLNNLGVVHEFGGDLAAARTIFERSLVLAREALGDRHPKCAMALDNLARVRWLAGDRAQARLLAGQALAVYESFVAQTLPALSQREQMAFLGESRGPLATVLGFTAGLPDQERDAYRHHLFWKGLAAESEALRAATGEPAARKLIEGIRPLRSRLNQLYNARVPADGVAEHARGLRDLTVQLSALEGELARIVHWKPQALEPEEVCAALPEHVALVDILVTVHYPLPKPGDHQVASEPWYVAFVVRRGAGVHRVELGPAAQIETILSTWRRQIQQRLIGAPAGHELARLVWEPLRSHLSDAELVVIAPDGDLAFLPWAALPDGKSRSVLLERQAFATVGSARQLVELTRNKPRAPGRGLLALGGVDYDKSEAGPEPATVAGRPGAVTRGALALGALPGTIAEADSIVALFHAHDPQAGAVLLSGTRATTDRLRAALPGRRYLHLATHGYFAPPEMKSALTPPEDDLKGLQSFEGMGRREAAGWYPGLLSGLVCAGANNPPKNPSTGLVDLGAGVLTAQEVSGMDLKGTDLVVLSACETGLGRVAGGEGVLGLERAFEVAGARTVVASLWDIGDEATQRLMVALYKNMWEKKLPKLEALRQAQLAMLSEFKPQGKPLRSGVVTKGNVRVEDLPEKKPADGDPSGARRPAPSADDRLPPFYWAAFVLSGDWR